jgi:hypothetical protein
MKIKQCSEESENDIQTTGNHPKSRKMTFDDRELSEKSMQYSIILFYCPSVHPIFSLLLRF